MPVRRIRGKWWIDFQHHYKRIRKPSLVNTREGACIYEASLRREVAIHGKIQVEKKTEALPSLSDFFPRWMNGYVMANNRKKEQELQRSVFERHLLPFFGGKRLNVISSEDIERYKGLKLSEGLAPKSINNHLVVLHKAFSSAVEWKILQEIPKMRHLKLPEPPFRYLTEQEAKTLIDGLKGLLHEMVLTALRTGMRYSELTALMWEDVDWENKLITVRRSQVEGVIGSTKNNRIRRIPMTDDVINLFIQKRQKSGLVFEENDHHVVYEVSRRRLRGSCENLGITIITWHDLRHTFASHLVAKGAPLPAVQKLLGHSDIKMTMRYAHLGPSQLQDAVDLLYPVTK